MARVRVWFSSRIRVIVTISKSGISEMHGR